MVNTGKPSPGCYLCRARRVKCDENKPQCFKCKKIGRDCPGYRDLNYRFRDETLLTIKKASRGQDKDLSPVESTGSRSSSDDDESPRKDDKIRREISRARLSKTAARLKTTPPPPNPVTAPIGHLATCYFLSSYVLVPLKDKCKGAYSFVHKIISQEGMDPTFSAAFQAVSLAALATKPSYRRVRPIAQSHYIRAVSEMRKAVTDPRRAKSTQTLASIHLLALYEVLACPGKSLDVYEAHVRGAMELVRLRGEEQLETAEGVEMVIMMKSRCLMLHALPNSHSDMNNDFVPFAETSYTDALGQLGPLINAHRDLRDEVAMALSGRMCDLDPPQLRNKIALLFGQCVELARKFRLSTTQCPPQHLAIPTDPEPGFPGLTRYTFADQWVGTFHVTCQGANLIMLHLAFRCLAFLYRYSNYTTTKEYEDCAQAARNAVQSLVASAYYSTEFASTSDDEEDRRAPPPVKSVAIMSLFCTAMASEFATEQQREYLGTRLRHMADEGGIAQAEALLEILSVVPRDDIERDKGYCMSLLGHSLA